MFVAVSGASPLARKNVITLLVLELEFQDGLEKG
jgi:hypothetical protein